MRLLFLVAVGVVGWLLYRMYFKVLLAQGRIGRLKIGMVVLGLIFLALAVTGRAPALFALVGALMTQAIRFAPLLLRAAPWLSRWLGPAAMGAGAAGAAGPRISKVTTRTLCMTLDQDSGEMRGEVLEGGFAGRALDSMSADDLQALHEACRRDDHDALRLLEAWLVRERPDDWAHDGRTGTGGDAGPEASRGAGRGAGSGSRSDEQARGGSMSAEEAQQVLGVAAGAQREEIVAAHRALMTRLHPDKGGSHYLASKVNQARQVLLRAD